MKSRVLSFITILALAIPMLGAGPAGVAPADWDIQNGHFFTQTAGDGMSGYSITNDNGVRFWEAFVQLGGAQSVGYPVSRRFKWNGFVVQVMQSAVFQWNPATGEVQFVNIFDLMEQAGNDAWLEAVRQVPRPKQWNDVALPWTGVVQNRLAVMDSFPAIKRAYFGAVGDPVQMNGLPTSDVVDTGESLVLRTQRAVIQQWKKDVPWAKKGEVTFALGGDIAKEAGLVPTGAGVQPERFHADKDSKFALSYPFDWRVTTREPTSHVSFRSPAVRPGGRPIVSISSAGARGETVASLFATMQTDEFRDNIRQLIPDGKVRSLSTASVGGMPGIRLSYTGTSGGAAVVITQWLTVKNNITFVLTAASDDATASLDEPTFEWMADSFKLFD